MSQHYRLLFSFVFSFLVVGIFISPAHSQSSPVSGKVVGWGADSGRVPSDLGNVAAVAAGDGHSLAIRPDGTVVAWGRNGEGQSTVPSGLSDVVAVAAGWWRSLALRSDGKVYAWGDNRHGQSTVPDGLEDVIAVTAGDFRSLALRSDGTVVAWGRSGFGQSTVPPDLKDVLAVAAGSFHSLAIVDNELSTNTEPADPEAPSIISLQQNYPIPFNPTTQIRYGIPQTAEVQLSVFNMLGQKVATLVDGQQSAGWHTASFDASGLSSGAYIYRIQAGEFVSTKKVMLIK